MDRDMFDTMTLTKITAALCTALLVMVLGSWLGKQIYSPGHHGDDHKAGYVIDTGKSEEGAAAAEGPDMATLLASADIEAGAKVFKVRCSSCHNLEDGKNGTGPHLYGIVNRAVSSVDGYNYSGNLVKAAQEWTPENLNAFITKPSKFARGTAMTYNGLSKEGQRADLIAYLATIGAN